MMLNQYCTHLPSMRTVMNGTLERVASAQWYIQTVGKSDMNEGCMLKESHTYEKRPT
jgi:hypothetical protein